MTKQFLRGLRTCERQGGWGKAFWWVRMALWVVLTADWEYQEITLAS